MTDDIPPLEFTPEPWTALAECRGMPVHWWFPPRGNGAPEAYAVCKTCPVQTECLEHALQVPERTGIWGGTSERARRKMRIARRLEKTA